MSPKILFLAILFLIGVSVQAQTQLLTTANSGLPDNYTYACTTDRLGRFWVATAEGIACYNGKDWTVAKKNNEVFKVGPAMAMCADSSNNIWVAAQSGLYKVTPNDVTVYNQMNNNFPGDLVFTVFCSRNGTVWAGTNAGAVAIKDGKMTVYDTLTSNLKNQLITGLCEDTSGNIIAGNYDGLFVFSGKQWDLIPGSSKLFTERWVKTMFVARNNILYAGTEENGVVTYNGKEFGTITSLNNGLPSDGITRFIQAPDGALWIITWAGAVHYTDKAEKVIDTRSGLTTNWISGMAFTPDGYTYVATQEGVLRFK